MWTCHLQAHWPPVSFSMLCCVCEPQDPCCNAQLQLVGHIWHCMYAASAHTGCAVDSHMSQLTLTGRKSSSVVPVASLRMSLSSTARPSYCSSSAQPVQPCVRKCEVLQDGAQLHVNMTLLVCSMACHAAVHLHSQCTKRCHLWGSTEEAL